MVFNIFMRQTLTNDFWGLHENMNCAFLLMTEFFKKIKKLYFWYLWTFFAQIWAKITFLKKELCPVFKYSSYLALY